MLPQRLMLAVAILFTMACLPKLAAAGALPQFDPPLNRELTYVQTSDVPGPDGNMRYVARHRFRYQHTETGLVLESLGSATENKAKDQDILPLLSGGSDLTIRFAVDDHGWPSHVLNWPTVRVGIQKRYEAAMPKKPACNADVSECNVGGMAFAIKYSNLAHKLERMDDRWLIGELMPWMHYAHELPLDAIPSKPIERKGRFNQTSGLYSLPGEERYEVILRDDIRFNLERTMQPENAADVIRMMSSLNVALNGGNVADMPSEQEVQEAARNAPPEMIKSLLGKSTTVRISYVFDAKSGLLIYTDEIHPPKSKGSPGWQTQVRLEPQ